MADVQLPSFKTTFGDIDNANMQGLQEIVKSLLNSTIILTEELTYLLNNLDTRNLNEVDGDILVTGTVTAKAIAANSVTAEKIQAGAVVAEKIDVGELSAISANLGHITAGLIEAVQIFGSIITGGTLQTDTDGSRIVINSNGLRAYDGNNIKRVAMGVNDAAEMAGHAYYGPDSSYEGQVYSVLGALHVIAANELFLRGYGNVLIQGDVKFEGSVDFSDANVTGL
ncbi:hypothetical protein FHR92_005240 [Fontibacillus solani]|uniref:Uncharacterized protein n=1 Tax=Fontibacillus solani TaxID=1572857 RepID=A0A7W3SYT4_9BACL|nr:hypothetical protein [Fontibacillus solani]MBA9088722.1 hypothetical protein [Fontibacillus solani]